MKTKPIEAAPRSTDVFATPVAESPISPASPVPEADPQAFDRAVGLVLMLSYDGALTATGNTVLDGLMAQLSSSEKEAIQRLIESMLRV